MIDYNTYRDSFVCHCLKLQVSCSLLNHHRSHLARRVIMIWFRFHSELRPFSGIPTCWGDVFLRFCFDMQNMLAKIWQSQRTNHLGPLHNLGEHFSWKTSSQKLDVHHRQFHQTWLSRWTMQEQTLTFSIFNMQSPKSFVGLSCLNFGYPYNVKGGPF